MRRSVSRVNRSPTTLVTCSVDSADRPRQLRTVLELGAYYPLFTLVAHLLTVTSRRGWKSMVHRDIGVLPDLHSEAPSIGIPVHSVGHVGVKRIVAIDEHDSAAMVVMDISVGLYAHQRGAHMSRLIECIDRPGPQPTVLDYAQGIFERLRDAVPGAASWSVDARATIVLPHDGGFKPIEEICRIEAAERTEVTWGAAFKVCLACPQAQSAIAFDRDDHGQRRRASVPQSGLRPGNHRDRGLDDGGRSFPGRPARRWRVRGQRAGAGTA